MAQSSEQAPFTSEIVGRYKRSVNALTKQSWVFSGCSGFLPQGKLTGCMVRINTVKKVYYHAQFLNKVK